MAELLPCIDMAEPLVIAAIRRRRRRRRRRRCRRRRRLISGAIQPISWELLVKWCRIDASESDATESWSIKQRDGIYRLIHR